VARKRNQLNDYLSGKIEILQKQLRTKAILQHYIGFDCPECSTSVGLIPEATFGKGEFNSHEDTTTLAHMKLWVCAACEAPYVTAPTSIRHIVKTILRHCCIPKSTFELKVLRHPQHIRSGKIRVKRRCQQCGITRHTHCYVPRLGKMISLGKRKQRSSSQIDAQLTDSISDQSIKANA
jgi:hypothetical protein